MTPRFQVVAFALARVGAIAFLIDRLAGGAAGFLWLTRFRGMFDAVVIRGGLTVLLLLLLLLVVGHLFLLDARSRGGAAGAVLMAIQVRSVSHVGLLVGVGDLL